MRFWVIGIILLLHVIPNSWAETEQKSLLGVRYFNRFFGQIHQNPSRYSASLTTIACGHPVKIYKTKNKETPEQIIFNGQYNLVSVGPYWGYIDETFLEQKKPECFQDLFPKFFDLFPLELADLYYWGKLYDMFVTGRSKVK